MSLQSNKLKPFITFALAIFMIQACGSEEPYAGSELYNTPVIELEVAVEAEQDDDFFMARPFRVRTDGNGSMFVADFSVQQIYRFGPDGALIERIGKEGSGPGEFNRLGSMSLGPDGRLYAYDNQSRRLSVFEKRDNRYHFTHATMIRAPQERFTMGVSYLTDDQFIGHFGAFRMGDNDDEEKRYEWLMKIDKDGNPADSVLTRTRASDMLVFESGGGMTMGPPHYGRRTVTDIGMNGSILTASGFDGTIRLLSSEIGETREFLLELPRNPVTQAIRDSIISRTDNEWSRYRARRLPDFKPILHNAFLAVNEDIWVQTGSPSKSEWAVFTSEGEIKGRIRVDSRINLTHACNEFAYGVSAGEARVFAFRHGL